MKIIKKKLQIKLQFLQFKNLFYSQTNRELAAKKKCNIEPLYYVLIFFTVKKECHREFIID